ncbi:glycerophosphodiester phosphodiesterase family protein [Flavobacterium columnare]|uniref:Glycerophosphodiester phosphodiesterase n=1 Tax=Flavobacterium columnare TaxID=996 RepID=A0A437UCH5_9FLAO|nr:glycerophosphodiester phosphodiesterase family protein [Flavobacterium columnare]RVU91322.1 glycerophosphodiester phosphodiesterase [Flavobacterium columnare]
MLKIGHRGAKGHKAENTIESFLKAFELGADGIELDVHLSSNGQAVVIHDPTIDRTIKNASGYVKNFTTKDCKKMGIPSLVEVFHILPKNAFLNIEIKEVLATKVIAEKIEEWVRLDKIQYKNVLVSSFSWEALEQIKKINPNIILGVLADTNAYQAFEFAKKIGAHSINLWFQLLTSDLIQLAHDHQIQVHAYTVNSSEDIIFVKKMGVDAIITDYPDRI